MTEQQLSLRHSEERGFSWALTLTLPLFLVLVVFSRLFSATRAVRGQALDARPSLLREAVAWARSSIAVGMQQ
jgi:hypothetical protein